MENYKIIYDEAALQDFIDNFLPDLTDDELFYVCLFARKKYMPSLVNKGKDKHQLWRNTCTKKDLVYKLRQLEIPVGRYLMDGIEMPNDGLAIYIAPNPRSIKKACANMAQTLVRMLATGDKFIRPNQLGLTELHRAKSRTVYVDFDFDKCDYLDKKEAIDNLIGMDTPRKILVTRGGFHLLLKPEDIPKQYNKHWYMGLKGLDGCDDDQQESDIMVPIPGCIQGGFIPKFIV